jgi:hypothetical protein
LTSDISRIRSLGGRTDAHCWDLGLLMNGMDEIPERCVCGPAKLKVQAVGGGTFKIVASSSMRAGLQCNTYPLFGNTASIVNNTSAGVPHHSGSLRTRPSCSGLCTLTIASTSVAVRAFPFGARPFRPVRHQDSTCSRVRNTCSSALLRCGSHDRHPIQRRNAHGPNRI